ncbi:MAG: flavodoxin family protein [Eubacteriaceae bacterium]|nr:flavodoxin family protein [Eubacteriaceae bacterium]
MKTLIVYDTFFGNTKQIAEAMGSAFDPEEVVISHVNDLKTGALEGVELLIAGSPTRAFRPTKGILDFIIGLPANSLKGVSVMAFDTRIDSKQVNNKVLNVMVKLFGYGAEPIGRKLEQKGGVLAKKPEGFFVMESEGPLKTGELERASKWAKK